METISFGKLLFLIVVAGVALWFVNAYVPMEARIKSLLNAVVIIFLVIVALFWLFGFLGIDLSTLAVGG